MSGVRTDGEDKRLNASELLLKTIDGVVSELVLKNIHRVVSELVMKKYIDWCQNWC